MQTHVIFRICVIEEHLKRMLRHIRIAHKLMTGHSYMTH